MTMGGKAKTNMDDFESNRLDSLNNDPSDVLRYYFFEPYWPRLKPRAFMVWSALLFKAVPMMGISSVSYDKIRVITGTGSNATIGKGISELIEKGYIRVLELGGARNQPTVYQLLHHHFKGPYDCGSEGKMSDLVCGAFESALDF